ncbi:MAG TPA: tRNA lysidine(34) synthetase TilS [Pyrinomonadaceae bacterium]|nr:tRNA lysidine(34) synthetase TilS [Pyrinomonadaceae bacterium]
MRKGRAARPRLSGFARRLLVEWKRLNLPSAEASIVVAVSGGADSTALLLGLDELLKSGRLALRLTVAHLNHGLRGEAGGADALWVSELASALGYEIKQGRVELAQRATARAENLEQAAREARYQFLAEAARECGARAVLTAHTMEDQAETVLLRLLRGSGADGLGGMEAMRTLEAGGEVLLVRPLLGWAERSGTEEYCRERSVEFRTDEMNEDERFARVRVRRRLLPLLQTFNGRVVEALARTASLLREDASILNSAAAELLTAASINASIDGSPSPLPPPLRVTVLSAAPRAVSRRALRQWIACGRGDLRRLEMVHLLAIEGLLSGERGGRTIELPGGTTVTRKRGMLQLHNRS